MAKRYLFCCVFEDKPIAKVVPFLENGLKIDPKMNQRMPALSPGGCMHTPEPSVHICTGQKENMPA